MGTATAPGEAPGGALRGAPPIVHLVCPRCYPGAREGQPDLTAICGTRGRQPSNGTGARCVVCQDLKLHHLTACRGGGAGG